MAVRISLLVKKLDTLSNEEFSKYWEGPHAKMFCDLPIVKEKVLKYTQFHIDNTMAKQLGLLPSEYDGEVTLWFKSLEDFHALNADAEYLRTVVPDANAYSKPEEGKWLIGYDKEFIADEKAL